MTFEDHVLEVLRPKGWTTTIEIYRELETKHSPSLGRILMAIERLEREGNVITKKEKGGPERNYRTRLFAKITPSGRTRLASINANTSEIVNGLGAFST